MNSHIKHITNKKKIMIHQRVKSSLVLLFIIFPVLLIAQNRDYGISGRFLFNYRIEDIPGTDETMFNSRIYFPDSAGVFPPGAIPAPIVVFGHGWMMGIDRYYSYAEHLASWGYIVCLPTISNPLINPEHERRARLMVDVARWIANLDTVPDDHFYRKLNRWSWAFTGHSMGGGLALLAADRFGLNDTLRVVAALHSPQTTPATRSQNITIPKLILAGSVDNIAPWPDIREAYWDSAPPPGTFAVIAGANHGYVMDYSYFWENGGTSRISRQTHQLIIRRHLTAYLERYLHNDTSDWNFSYCFGDSIYGHPSMESVEVRLPPVGTEDTLKTGAEKTKTRSPITSGILHIETETALLDINGRRVLNLPPGLNNISLLNPGVYFATVDNKKFHKIVIIKK